MVIVDWFTKIIKLKATMTAVSLKEIAKIYSDDIWKIYKIPKKILSDRRFQFTSWFMEDLNMALGMKWTLSTVYHPQTDD